MLKSAFSFCAILFLFFAAERSVIASPLDPTPYKVKQANGTEIILRNFGDEWYSYIQTIDGYTVGASSSGSFFYCKKDPSGNLTLSDVLVNPEVKRSSREKKYLKKVGKNLQPDQHIIDQLCERNPYNLKNIDNLQSIMTSLRQKSGGSQVINLCVLLVEFDDVAHTISREEFDVFFNGDNPTTVKSYYKEASYGDVEVRADVFDWYRDNTTADNRDYSRPVEQMLNNAILGNDEKIDFSKYDNDGDGKLDGIIMIYAGEFQQNNSETNYNFGAFAGGMGSNYQLVVDGVEINRMCCSSELNAGGNPMAVGVTIHELGHHLFHLPDLYDTAYKTAGVGTFCTMGTLWLDGGWTPPMLCAFCREKAGLAKPILIEENSDKSYEIPMAYNNREAIFRINMPDNPTEYFLVENRQKHGNDKFLKGDGLLIWHMDIKMSGNNSTNSDHQRISLKQADGRNDLQYNRNSGDSGDPFPGNRLKRVFDKSSNPNSNDWYDHETGISVYNISDSDSIMTIDIRVPEKTVGEDVVYFDLVANDFETGWGSFDEKPRAFLYTGEIHAYEGNNAAMISGSPGWNGAIQGPWTTIDASFQQIRLEFYFKTEGFKTNEKFKLWIWDGDFGNKWTNNTFTYDTHFQNDQFYKASFTMPKGTDFSFNPNANFAIIPEAASTHSIIYVDNVTLSGAFKKDVDKFTYSFVEVEKGTSSVIDTELPFSLQGPYPNPFISSTNIRFELNETSDFEAFVYNQTGQIVQTVTRHRSLAAGTHQFSWDGKGLTGQYLPNGLYFIMMRFDNYHISKKVILDR